MKEREKQVIYSGILGDGCLKKGGSMAYSCHYKEYMVFKHDVLFRYCESGVKESANMGYKKGSAIFKFATSVTDFAKDLMSKDPIEESIKNLDEFGLALLMYDDGSRHKKNNFYNINTHALSDTHQNMLVEKLKGFNVFPQVLTETKKDGRMFSYLFISKWEGAMELSSMMRKVPLECYTYKLVPEDLENAYFEVKDTEKFKSITSARGKTNYIKKVLGIGQRDYLETSLPNDVFVKD